MKRHSAHARLTALEAQNIPPTRRVNLDHLTLENMTRMYLGWTTAQPVPAELREKSLEELASLYYAGMTS